jgi:hypothetical protein
MVNKGIIWLALISMCLWPAPAATKLIGVCWDSTDSSVVEINSANGSMRTIGSSGFACLNSLARDDSGLLFSVGGATKDKLIRIDPVTGLGTLVATLNFGNDPVDVRGLAFAPRTGFLYAINCRPGSGSPPRDLYRINMLTGEGTRINSSSLGAIQSIAFDSSHTLYGWDIVNGLVTIDPATGVVTDVNPGVGGTDGIQGIVVTAGGFFGAGQLAGENAKLYIIKWDTGEYTLVGTAAGPFDVRGIDFAPDAVLSALIGTCWSGDNSRVVSINRTTGSIRNIGLSGYAYLNSLAKSPEFRHPLYSVGGTSKNELIQIDPRTGAGTLDSTLNYYYGPLDVRALAFHPGNGSCVVGINRRPGPGLQPSDYIMIELGSGNTTRLSPDESPLPQVQSITFSPGKLLYGWDTGNYGLIRIHPDFGTFTDVNPAIGGMVGIQAIAFAPNGTLYGAGRVYGENDKLYIIDKITGAYSLVGEASEVFDVRGIEFIKLTPRILPLNLILMDR